MAENDSVFTFGADTKPLESAVDGIESRILSFGKSAAGAVAGIFAGKVLIGAFNEATAAALESEKAVKQFEFALKSAGVFSEKVSAQFQDYAASLQKVSGVQDEVILEGTARLIQIGQLSGEELNRSINAALRLAKDRGIEAADAFEMLSRAAAGNVGQFARMGIQFKQNASDAEKFNTVLGFIETKMQDASLATNTYRGAKIALSNALSDANEKLGDVIINSPLVIGAINKMTESVKFLEFFVNMTIKGVRDWGAAFQWLGSVFASVSQGIGLLDFDRIAIGVQQANKQFYDSTVASQAWLESTMKIAAANEQVLIPSFKKVKESEDEVSEATEKLRLAQGEWEAKQAQIAADSVMSVKNLKTGFVQSMKEMSVSVVALGKTVGNIFVSGFSNAFAAVGKALVKGEDAMGAFGKAVLSMLGQIAQQMGQFYIAAGIAALFLNPAQGAGMIAAGAALSVLGGVLQALGGDSGGGAAAAGGAGRIGASRPVAFEDTQTIMNEMTEDEERIAPNTGVQVIVQGNILDRRETGLAIAEIINESFYTNGTTITANA